MVVAGCRHRPQAVGGPCRASGQRIYRSVFSPSSNSLTSGTESFRCDFDPPKNTFGPQMRAHTSPAHFDTEDRGKETPWAPWPAMVDPSCQSSVIAESGISNPSPEALLAAAPVTPGAAGRPSPLTATWPPKAESAAQNAGNPRSGRTESIVPLSWRACLRTSGPILPTTPRRSPPLPLPAAGCLSRSV